MEAPDEIARKAREHGGWVERTIVALLERDMSTAPCLTFTLPLGVSVNHMYVVTSRGVRLCEEARDFKASAGTIVRNAAQLAGWSYREGMRLRLSLTCYVPNNRRADISNLIKVTEDAIADALNFDDRHIWEIRMRRAGIDKQNPRCDVALEVLE